MKTAVITGSFDPVTNGHYDLILRARELFGRVLVAVLDNSEKRFLLSAEERAAAMRACFKKDENIEIIIWNNLLADLIASLEDPVIVRGARGSVDFEYERMLFEINRELAGVESVVLPAKREYGYISSTFVRELIKYDRPMEGYVPDAAIAYLEGKK